jgi:hypothetical protein
MKLIILFFSILFLSGISGCDKKEDPIDPVNITVEKYISLLRSDSYNINELPAFMPSDIPSLLEYRNEEHIIRNFPRNPISSFAAPECRLGVYVLWTIESIRAIAIESEFLIDRFPTQNPYLGYRNGELLEIDDELAHEITAEAYYDWWETNKEKNVDEFMSIDPLIETEYRWR